MKKALIFLLVCLVPMVLFAGGSQDDSAEKEVIVLEDMEKIVFLSASHHDNPDALPLWAAEFKALTGVDVVLKTVSSKDSGEAMMAKFMAGEIPDIVKFGESNIEPLARQEFIIPLDDMIENSPGIKKLKEMFPTAFDAHSLDGVVYGIPSLSGSQRGLWVRTDILKKLNLSMPTSLEEFVYVMKKIKDEYPSGDGGVMYPYISKTYHSGYLPVLSNYFDVSPHPIMKRPLDSQYRDGWDTPLFKDYAEFVRMMWDEKLIDPDHALPQKASNTRSKFYAGKGAFLSMWTNRYPNMIAELRKEFPEAELALVPPFDNPKGGTLGMSVIPGFKPYCITSEAANPQFVFDNFIEPIFLTVEGAMLTERGVKDFHYKIINNTLIDNFEESGAHMATQPFLNSNLNVPYKFPQLAQIGLDFENQFIKWFNNNSNFAIAEVPTFAIPAYDMIRKDMEEKKHQLFWKYVIGEIEYNTLINQFNAYKKEIDFDSILAEINSRL